MKDIFKKYIALELFCSCWRDRVKTVAIRNWSLLNTSSKNWCYCVSIFSPCFSSSFLQYFVLNVLDFYYIVSMGFGLPSSSSI